MSLIRVCALADVPSDEGLSVQAEEYTVVIARDGDDVYALQDLCSHAAVSLSEGEVSDCQIECWLHGSRFDLATGKPLGLPATQPVATFAVEIRHGDVYVDVATTLNGVNPA